MKAVILAGGLGTRLSEETDLRPKPMIEIGGRPILWHIMKIYSAQGVNEFIICAGYKGYVIKEYFANYALHNSDVTFDFAAEGGPRFEVHRRRSEPWRVTIVDTGETTQTGGRLKRVQSYLGNETFCFTYGDGVGNIDVEALVAFRASVDPCPAIVVFSSSDDAATTVAALDAGVVWALLLLLEASGRPRERVVLYAWNPLAVVESAASGHVEPLGVLFVTLAVAWCLAQPAITSPIVGASRPDQLQASVAALDVTLGPPRSIIVLELLITTSLIGALRFSPRLAQIWSLDRFRAGERIPTLIVGAGSAGELLLRDLYRSDEHPYRVAGLVDDDPQKQGMSIGGRRVLGRLDAVPALVEELGIRQLLFAIPRLPAARVREVLAACARFKLTYKILPVSFAYLNDRVSVSMLQDLDADDLLPRAQVRFEPREIEELIAGRRILVTGAAGSIGSEICRQVAELEPATLVLVDTDENALYLQYRELQARHPSLVIAPEVADVRDPRRLRGIGAQYRPQDVFHAAARKHVPFMESMPEDEALLIVNPRICT